MLVAVGIQVGDARELSARWIEVQCMLGEVALL
jgi:hypothetical protein